MFILPFKSRIKSYIFDVNTNLITPVSENLYGYLNKTQPINESSRKELEFLVNQGMLKNNPIKSTSNRLNEFAVAKINRSMSHLVLQITQNCNLKCGYCPYSAEEGFNRKHCKKTMTVNTIEKAIDYYLMHSVDAEEIAISFYGGEPLLEIDLINYAIRYANKRLSNSIIKYSMTTNGTLFNKVDLTEINNNNFTILISLDGPKYINDKNRKFPDNNRSVYDIVNNNINYLKSQYPKIYKQVNINSVIDQRLDLSHYKDFYDYWNAQGKIVTSSIIDDTSMVEDIKASKEYQFDYLYIKFLTYLDMLGVVDFEKPYNKELCFQTCENILNGLNRMINLQVEESATGCCLFGYHKLFVDVEGNFLPCERVLEVENNIIGEVKKGLNFEKTEMLLNYREQTSLNCKECFAIRNCNTCLKGFDTQIKNKILKTCEGSKIAFNNKLHAIATFIEILELNKGVERDHQ